MDNQDKQELPAVVKALLDRLSQTIRTCSIETESFSCEKCRDTEMIPVTDEEGNVRFKKCDCVQRKRAERMLKESGLADAIDQQTFDSFVEETQMQQTIKSKAMKYLDDLLKAREDWNPRAPWFYIGGNPGSGKTHICTAICGELLKRNIGVKYMKWVEEARRLKLFVNDDDFSEMVAEYSDISVLYIDDLLKQKFTQEPSFTEADIKIAFTILNERYIRNKPTIISSEWDLIRHLRPADEGTFSRVYERCKGHTVSISRDGKNNFRMRGIEP